MAHAYTPGLKVTQEAVLKKRRRLPLLGEVLVKEGEEVTPETVVARTELPGNPHTVAVHQILGIEPEHLPECMVVKPGDKVAKGQIIAKYAAFFGLMKRDAKSPIDGVVEVISPVTGQVTLREPAIPVQISAYIKGKVAEVLPQEGVVIETKGAFIQGIFGVGGERQGVVKIAVDSADAVLTPELIGPDCQGKIVVGGSLVTGAALKKAAEVGAAGVVAGGIIDTDLIELLGYDIGVAITGHEDIPITLIITEGFGRIRMADKTFSLLKAVDGETASINGATQIRAGVMRPEIIVPGHQPKNKADTQDLAEGMTPGTPIRIIREPYFGMLAEVVELPPELVVIETEAKVRILKAKLADGRVVTIPRANVEIIEG
ncbi:MAG: hypothetical protein AB1331_02950 [Bacillota bacterium]